MTSLCFQGKTFSIRVIQVYAPVASWMGFHSGSDGKESTCNARDLGSIPGLEKSPGGEHGNPLQYSCLENPMDREEPGWVQSRGSQRVRHNWSNLPRIHNVQVSSGTTELLGLNIHLLIQLKIPHQIFFFFCKNANSPGNGLKVRPNRDEAEILSLDPEGQFQKDSLGLWGLAVAGENSWGFW